MRFPQPAFSTLLAAVAVAACTKSDGPTTPNTPASGGVQAEVAGVNGQIAYDRNDGEAVLVVNPDGSDVRELASSTCCPEWSPDGSMLALPALSDIGTGTFAIINADGSGYTRWSAPTWIST